ncbi:MAG: acriflavine resistance protein B [Lentisphaerae bacterium GWF2_44_16]|nr:MAG: acriflavine resistance protein B [Lentisphaerae bacterium GWF2_44_16]
MNLSKIFIVRPVMTTLLTIGVIIFGLMSYPLLPVSDLPNVDFPVIVVSAGLPGASPETMATAVATPLEKQFSTISGLDMMTSTSALGTTLITLQFNLDKSIDAAAQDVQSAISQTLKQMPSDMPSPPSYKKVNPGDQPVIYLALFSETLPMSKLDYYAQTLMSQRLATLKGVAQVQIFGSMKYAVRIRLDPKLMSSWQIGIDEVQTAIQNANVNLPTGALNGRYQSFTIQADGQLFNAERYKPIIVAYRDNAPIRLRDIAEVYDSVEEDKAQAWYCTSKKQQTAIVLGVQRQPGTNTVEVADEVKKLLPVLRSQLPAAISLEVIFDRSEPIKESVFDVEFTMVLTLFLVVFVIFLFLRNFRATVIPSMTLPMSIIGTFVVMYLLGYSLDNLSLMALTLSIGFVVDDAIVMLENIFRHVEMGKSVYQAALDGSAEIAFTILSMTISLSAVFIPVLFMGGVVGRLFREFGVVIAVSVLVSGIVSLSLTPMLASRFLKASQVHELEGDQGMDKKHLAGYLKFYDWTLRWTIQRWVTVMLFLVAVLILTGYLFVIIPKGFLPSEDRNSLFAQTECAQGVSFDAMKEHQQAAAAVVQNNPDVEAFMSRAGVGGLSSTGNTGFMFMRLKPRSERKLSADQILQDLRKKFYEIPGIRVFIQNMPSIQIGGRMTKGQYQYTLQSSDTAALYEFSKKIEKEMSNMPEIEDVNSDLQISNPQVNLEINREKASMLHITAAQIENALYSAFGPRKISTIYAAEDQYSVLLELKAEFKMDRESLSTIYVRSQKGDLVPLTDIADIKYATGPLTVNHSGQLPSVTISFNLKPGASLGQAVSAIEKRFNSEMPSSISAIFQGTAQAFQSSMKGMLLLLICTVFVIYIVLGILYESFIHPITILTALPFAGLGALLSLLVCNTELSLYAYIGIIMLVGIVKKNGIMMIDFAIEAQKEEGKTAKEAIIEACLIRFRPIMMTTAAAIMAGIPVAIGWGGGGEARRPLGITLVGGLIFSQLLTLYVTPVFYVCMERLREFCARKKKTSGTVAG